MVGDTQKKGSLIKQYSKMLPIGTPVGVIGAGTMGEGIAQVLLVAGYHVSLYDQSLDSANSAIKSIHKRLERLVEKGILGEESKNECLTKLKVVDNLKSFSDAVMVVEAIIENLTIKQELFKQLESITSESTIFATNTSSISITAIGSSLKRPERLAGWHFFNPAPLMALVEVVTGLATSKEVAESLYDTALFCGKTPVYAKSTPGFIVNRVARPFYAESLRVLLETNESIPLLDKLIREVGSFKMGPFELMDLIGNDVNYSVTESVWNAYYNDARFTPSLIQKEYVDAGYYGRKTGRGFYHYDSGKKVIADEPTYVLSGSNIAAFQSDKTVISLNTQSVFYEVWHGLLNNAGIKVDDTEDLDRSLLMTVDGIACYITNGSTAAEIAYKTKSKTVVLFDLALDYTHIKTLAVARNKGGSDADFLKVIGLLRSLGIQAIQIADTPGLLVMRTVAMLVNEAADVVNQGVSAIADVDVAMRLGVGYPEGPLKWADNIGINHIYLVLSNLYRIYGDTRYRISPKLQEKYYLGESFYE